MAEIASNLKEHYYLSTACLHSLHEKCRLTCKYCETDCICACHIRKRDGDVTSVSVLWKSP